MEKKENQVHNEREMLERSRPSTFQSVNYCSGNYRTRPLRAFIYLSEDIYLLEEETMVKITENCLHRRGDKHSF